MNSSEHHWQNWSGRIQGKPREYLRARSESDVIRFVKSMDKVRVCGSGHSFSDIVVGDGGLLAIDDLNDIIALNGDESTSTVGAGVQLQTLGNKLFCNDQALINQGDVDVQTLAGAVSTGTHGTGAELPCLSAFVRGMKLVLANGEVIFINQKQDPDFFDAARVSLGLFGVLTEITMSNRRAYRLKEKLMVVPLMELLENFDLWKTQYRHLESFIFPHTDKALLKTLELTDEPVSPPVNKGISDDAFLKLFSELVRFLPKLNPMLQAAATYFVDKIERVDYSYRIFPSVRSTRFNEMEYHLPAEDGVRCLKRVLEVMRQSRLGEFFPVEFRAVAADDAWISPFYKRNSTSIAIHRYYKNDPWELFTPVEKVFREFNGRPHWGKMFSVDDRGPADWRELYPRWDDFCHLRSQLDPGNKFLNRFLGRIFLPQ